MGPKMTASVDAPGRDAEESARLACLIAGSRFVLRTVASRRHTGGGDSTDAVIVAAVVQANVRRALDTGAYETFDEPVPADLREPASVPMLAARTGLPRETVRRRLEALVARKRCVRAYGGYLVPVELMSGPERRALAIEAYEALRRLTADVQRAGLDVGASSVVEAILRPIDPASPVRVVNRATAAFAVDFLREVSRLTGSHEAALIYLALLEAVKSDGTPRRLTFLGLAQSMERPLESTRRRAMVLVERGLAERDEEGFKVRRDFATSADVRGLAAASADQMRAMYASIANVAAGTVRT